MYREVENKPPSGGRTVPSMYPKFPSTA